VVTKDEALKEAYETLKDIAENATSYEDGWCGAAAEEVLPAIEAALAQPAQEEECKHQFQVDQDAPKHKCCQICGLVVGSSAQPAQESEPDELAIAIVYMSGLLDGKKKRPWVGLTDEDEIPWDGVDAKSFAKAIEAKLKKKNS